MKHILTLMLAVALLSCCALADMPLTDEPVTLRFAAPVRVEHTDYDKMWMFNKYEEITGVHIEWDLVPDAGWQERKNLLLASEDLPDVFFRGNMSATELTNYGVTQGFIIPLDDLIDEYAPNIKAILEEYPDVDAAIRLNGKIYGLPQIIPALGPRTNPMWINTKWLEKCGLDMPKTVDEFLNMCIEFTQCDYNGDGEANEYAINLRSSDTSINNLYNGLYGMFGMRTLGVNSGWFDLDENGEYRFFPASERCKEMFAFTAELWANGCFDPDFLTQSNAQLSAKALENQFGILGGVNSPVFCSEDVESWVCMPALTNEYGETMWNAVGSMLNNYGTFAITKACERPDLAIQWADYFYSKEGVLLVYWGIEGETYTIDENGNLAYTALVTEDPVGVGNFLPKSGSVMPLIQIPEIVYDFTQYTFIAQAAGGELLKEFSPTSIWYPVLTAEENTELSNIETDIDNYVKESRIRFMMGELNVEDDWDAYVEALNQMGIEKYMEIYSAAYERAYS